MTRKHLARLFDSNPPRSPELLERLFENRERELRLGEDILCDESDFAAVQAVSGPTQTGKSHFVRLLLHRIHTKHGHCVVEVNANNRGSAQAVLEELFTKLWHELQGIEQSEVPDGELGIWEDALASLGRLEPLVLHNATELESVFTDDEELTLKAGATLKPPGMELSAEGQAHYKQQSVRRWKSAGLSTADLVELIRYEGDVLGRLRPGSRIFVFIDDLDLLHQPGSTRDDRMEITQCLRAIADTGPLVVVTTLRSAFFNGREKDFSDFMRLDALPAPKLRAVHQRHIDEFHAGELLFDEAALARIDLGAEGRVGIYLSLCNRIWKRFADLGHPIGEDDVDRYAGERLDAMRRDGVHLSLLLVIEKTVREGRLEVRIEEDIGDTDIIYRVLNPIPGRAGAYAINPFYVQAIQRRIAAEG